MSDRPLTARNYPGPGTRVEVRSRFDGAWCHGFEVAEVVDSLGQHAFRLRRLSDGAVLPALFSADDVAWHPAFSSPRW
jgi:hypothetical protein